MKEGIKTKQYELSKRFIELKVKHRLRQSQIANLMNLPIDRYLQMEQCDLNIDIKEYLKAIETFEDNHKKLIERRKEVKKLLPNSVIFDEVRGEWVKSYD